MNSSDPLLAHNWPKSMVSECLDAGRTVELACFLRERYRERFFEPIRLLRSAPSNEQGFGFAIMAVCCLMVETIQCYREGLPSSHQTELQKLKGYSDVPVDYQVVESDLTIHGKEIFRRFFSDNQSYFHCVDGITFYHSIRNGLLHQAQTKDGWTIDIGMPKLWDAEEHYVDRNLFSCQLESCFGNYLSDLSTKSFDQREWRRAAKKIWWLCRLS